MINRLVFVDICSIQSIPAALSFRGKCQMHFQNSLPGWWFNRSHQCHECVILEERYAGVLFTAVCDFIFPSHHCIILGWDWEQSSVQSGPEWWLVVGGVVLMAQMVVPAGYCSWSPSWTMEPTSVFLMEPKVLCFTLLPGYRQCLLKCSSNHLFSHSEIKQRCFNCTSYWIYSVSKRKQNMVHWGILGTSEGFSINNRLNFHFWIQ